MFIFNRVTLERVLPRVDRERNMALLHLTSEQISIDGFGADLPVVVTQCGPACCLVWGLGEKNPRLPD
jgi:hypothetical protein